MLPCLKSPKSALYAACLAASALPMPAPAHSPDGEALLEALRERIASGRGGQSGYAEALDLLASDPGGGCAEWKSEGAAENAADPALEESLRTLCGGAPDSGAAGSRRPRGSPRLALSASQTVKPQGAGRDDARWSARGSAGSAEAEATGRGAEWRRRRIRLVGSAWAVQAGHLERAWEDTRIPAVAGRAAFPGAMARSGLGGPMASDHPGLDGLALSLGSGPWRAQAAAAWNRLAPPPSGVAADPGRRDVGSLVAGLALRPAHGPETRLQALALRLEGPDGRRAEWLGVAGGQIRGGAAALSWRAAAALAGGTSARPGGYAEAAIGFRETAGSLNPAGPDGANASGTGTKPVPPAEAPTAAGSSGGKPLGPGPELWRLSLRQAAGGWANPLQSPLGNLRDTGTGWAGDPAPGGLRAESSFPLARGGSYAAGLEASAAIDWTGREAADPGPGGDPFPEWDGIRGDACLVQSFGPWTWTAGAGLGQSRTAAGPRVSGGWRTAWEWRHGAWRATAALSRRSGSFAGSRPMPLALALARAPGPGSQAWRLEWSAADARRPGRAQRLDLRQSWPAGRGLRVEQRLRVPWGPSGGAAGEASYQLGLAADF